MITVRGASVLTTRGFEVADVNIDDGLIAGIGAFSSPGADIIDGSGLVLGPGFVDIHVHFRDPGQTWKEDTGSGTRAAAAGGFTAVVAMPNTIPAIDSSKMAHHVLEQARSMARVDLTVAGALTKDRDGLEMADLDGMYEMGVRIFTDDGDSVADAGLLRRLMTYLVDLPGAVVAQHAEDASIADGGHLHDGLVSQRLGVGALPGSAEEVVIARDVILAAETGVHYHAQHVSTRGSVEIIRRAKGMGISVTAEVTPHHLTLDDESCADLDPNTKMYPPLRARSDVDALREALSDGVIDVVATDHAPHTRAEKDVPFEAAPRGIVGLETAFPLALAALGGDLGLVFQRMSIAPASIAGLDDHGSLPSAGVPANLVLVDPHRRWTVRGFESKSSNSPFVGHEMVGQVVATIYGGNVVHRGSP